MPTTVTKNNDGSISLVSDKYGKSPALGRFPVHMEMIEALVCNNAQGGVAGAHLSPHLVEALHFKTAPTVQSVAGLAVRRGGGGTQSKSYVIKMAAGPNIYFKILAKGVDTDKREQQAADNLSRTHTDDQTSPLLLALGYVTLKCAAPPKPPTERSEAIFFEAVDAIQIAEEQNVTKRATGVGRVLGALYKNQMTKENRLAKFYGEEGGLLSKVIVHDDFQMSNILQEKETHAIYLCDLGGLNISRDAAGAYRNLREAINDAGTTKDLAKTLITSFLNEFDAQHRAAILGRLITELKTSNKPADVSGRGAEFDQIAQELAHR